MTYVGVALVPVQIPSRDANPGPGLLNPEYQGREEIGVANATPNLVNREANPSTAILDPTLLGRKKAGIRNFTFNPLRLLPAFKKYVIGRRR